MKVSEIIVPPDKSISHRAVMLASISKGATRIKNLLMGEDILRTMEAFKAMGVRIDVAADVVVHGVGMRGLKKPEDSLYLGNSGTTMRILPGILAGQDFEVVLTGDDSLSNRPMSRIVEPLRMMGADVSGRGTDEIYPPLKIKGKALKAIRYKSKIASAQVKSCILMAALYADGVTAVSEPVKSRDHTERMLNEFGVRCRSSRLGCEISGPAELKSPGNIEIPGDISSAAFFMVAGCILPDRKIVLKNVGLNPTRTGIIDILKKMGAAISLPCGKDSGDIIVESSRLRGVTILPKDVVRAIDEIPIIMVAACFSKGTTVIKGIGELRVKETDRIRSMVTNLQKIGADIKVATGEKILIKGGSLLHGAKVSSFGDHRTAMSMLIAGLAIKDNVEVTGLECINKSFPDFEKLLTKLV